MLDLSSTPTPKVELVRRRDAVLTAMSDEGISQAIFTTPENIYYLTGIELGGFTTQQALILNADGSHGFVLRLIELNWRNHWTPLTWCTDWFPYSDDENPADVISRAAKGKRSQVSGTLGLELDRRSISYDTVTRIARATGAPSIVPVAHLIERLRVRKTRHEIEYMRRAGEITGLGIEAGAAAIREGATDAEAAAAGFKAMCQSGSEFFALGPFASCGPRTAMAHARWARVAPRPGEVVPLVMSASIRRYQCPLERTYTKGEPNRRTSEMLDGIVRAVENVLGNLRPGLTSHEADRLARDVIERDGFGEFFVHRLAYSIGMAYPPTWGENDIMQLRPNDKRIVEAGMTFHLVPALYVPNIGFLIRSMPVLVTKTGCEPLSAMPLHFQAL